MYHNDRWQSHSQEMNTLTALSLDSVIINDEFDSTPKEIPPASENVYFAIEHNVKKDIHGDKANRDIVIGSVTNLNDNSQSKSLTSPQQSSQEHTMEKTFGSESHKVNTRQESTEENRCSSNVPYQATVDSESGISSPGSKFSGESSSGSGMPRSPILPPCRICHEKASGIHYGLNTCEACKGFFRRSLKSNKMYKCKKHGKCDVVKKRRSSCSFCRLKKCTDLGMSKEAIKTGRYTHEFHSKNIMEVKQNTLDAADVSESDRSSQDICHQSIPDSLIKDPAIEAMIKTVDEAQNLLFEKLDTFLNKDIMAAQQQSCKERYRKFCQNLGVTALTENTAGFGSEKRQVMLEIYITYMENGVKGLVAFSKQLPDFTNLHIDDKAALIKNSVFDVWQIGVHKCIDPEKTVISGMDSMHRDELSILWGRDFIDEMFNNLECLKKLDLTRQEMGILRGICLSFSDRVELQNRTMVEELHWKFIECLRYLTLQRFPNFGPRFSQIISCLVKMRGVNEQFMKASENMKMVWPFIQNSPIAYEVFFNE
ncbi:hypothetical protein ACJMK2_020727 [Sinanodonta woodiana]|uniref:Uncharacterized protein n=1 Tax=Sinanodonta woodiana TaxID=1069815 RepID=A0ABD3TZZ4_SINWO